MNRTPKMVTSGVSSIEKEIEAYRIVSNSSLHLCALWSEYAALFREQADCDLLNRTARGFARLTQVMLMESLCLGICRLLDSAENRAQKNASLSQLLKTRRDLDPRHSRLSEFERKLEDLKSHAGKVRKIRDKLIAHHDLDVAVSPKRPGETLSVVNDIVVQIGKFMEQYTLVFRSASAEFTAHRFRRDVGAERLLAVLRASPLLEAKRPLEGEELSASDSATN